MSRAEDIRRLAGLMGWTEKCEPVYKPGNFCMMGHGGASVFLPPWTDWNPYENIADAMMLLERFPCDNQVTRFEVYEGPKEFYAEVCAGGKVAWSWGETRCDAICNAALKALEAEA